jgi:hypothetical protein
MSHHHYPFAVIRGLYSRDPQTKSNRDNGSYATGDLYQPHPSKRDVWRYAGRGDDVIVMVRTIRAALWSS